MRKILLVFGIGWFMLCFAEVKAQSEFVQFEHENGKVASEGTMLNGKPEGYWKTYHPDGTLKSEGNRENHELDSIWRFYSPEGILTQSISYESGKKDGKRITYDEEGALMKEETFQRDIPIDTLKRYHASGSIASVTPFDTTGKGVEQGIGFEYAEDDGRVTAIIEYRNGFIADRERINRKDKFGQRQGMWKTFHQNMIVATEGRYRNDKKHGYFKRYDEQGNLSETLKYEDGILIPDPEELAKLDIKRTYHDNAEVKSVGSYNKGVKEGVHRIYSKEGKVESAKIYNKGKVVGNGVVDDLGRRQGPWKEYYDTGELRSEGNYKDGRREGEWIFYYRDGSEEQRGAYFKGKPDGEWKWTYPNGQTWREEVYYDGLEEGLAIEYNDTGKVVAKGEYLAGEREGYWFLDLGDHREEGNYVAGLRNGVWKYFYPNGKLRFEGKFTQGREDGRHTYYYENGQVEQTGSYKFGQEEGDWYFYNREGQVEQVLTYRAGVLTRVDGDKVDSADNGEQ